VSERDGFEPGVPCWVAGVHPDPSAAAGFYTQLFGWEAENLMPPDHPADYFLCTLRGRRVAALVSQHGAPPPPQPLWGTYVWVDDADESAAKASELGGALVGGPFDSPGGGRMAVLTDPSGAGFGLWQPGENTGAQVVNEPGAWAMSDLRTPDLDGAEAFYGELFGWQTETFEMGEDRVTMWRLPGYVGGEPEQPVSREVVAVSAPLSDGPPRWDVNFWVDDADGAAEKTAELGGTVVVEPFDTPGFRNAVVADPQGAVFSVSQLKLAG